VGFWSYLTVEIRSVESCTSHNFKKPSQNVRPKTDDRWFALFLLAFHMIWLTLIVIVRVGAFAVYRGRKERKGVEYGRTDLVY
jgi:hypothetical protein